MWRFLGFFLILAFTSSAQNVTFTPDDSKLQYIGVGWQQDGGQSPCGASSQVVASTEEAGDSVQLNFEGASQVTVFASTSINGAKVQFNIDSSVATVDLSLVGNGGVYSCFPIFSASNLSVSEIHTLKATHVGAGDNSNLQGFGIFTLTRLSFVPVRASAITTSSVPTDIITVQPTSTQPPIVSPSASTSNTQPVSTLAKKGPNAGLIVGVLFLLFAIAGLCIAAYFYWRRRAAELRVTRTSLTPVVITESHHTFGDPDIVGALEKQLPIGGEVDDGSGFFPGTMPRVRSRQSVVALSRPYSTIIPTSLPVRVESKVSQPRVSMDTLPELPEPTRDDSSDFSGETVVESMEVERTEQHSDPPFDAESNLPSQEEPLELNLEPPTTKPVIPTPSLRNNGPELPNSLKPGNPLLQLGKLVIPPPPPTPLSPEVTRRPVSAASSWRTIATPSTIYMGVISFADRQVLRVEQATIGRKDPLDGTT